jgi:hypothetical protein
MRTSSVRSAIATGGRLDAWRLLGGLGKATPRTASALKPERLRHSDKVVAHHGSGKPDPRDNCLVRQHLWTALRTARRTPGGYPSRAGPFHTRSTVRVPLAHQGFRRKPPQCCSSTLVCWDPDHPSGLQWISAASGLARCRIAETRVQGMPARGSTIRRPPAVITRRLADPLGAARGLADWLQAGPGDPPAQRDTQVCMTGRGANA